MPSLHEELTFRGVWWVLLALAIDRTDGEGVQWKALAVTTLLFGSVHAVDLSVDGGWRHRLAVLRGDDSVGMLLRTAASDWPSGVDSDPRALACEPRHLYVPGFGTLDLIAEPDFRRRSQGSGTYDRCCQAKTAIDSATKIRSYSRKKMSPFQVRHPRPCPHFRRLLNCSANLTAPSKLVAPTKTSRYQSHRAHPALNSRHQLAERRMHLHRHL